MLTSDFTYNDNVFDNKVPVGNGGSTSLSYKVRIDDRQYFMKMLRPELQGDLRSRTLFYKEFEIGSSISSEHIVKYHKICEDSDGLYILLEYIYGSTLEELLCNDMNYFANENNLWRFLLQLLEGLKCFHSQGIAYLDFSPCNIMLTQVGHNVKIIDLGYCFNNAHGHTAGSTLHFAPPEIKRLDEIDERSDIYSVGRLMEYIQEKSGASYSKHFKRILSRCLDDDKEKRFASADEMIRAIRRRNLAGKMLLFSLPVMLALAIILILFASKENTVSMSGVDYRILSMEDSTCEVTGGEGDKWNIYIAGSATIGGKRYKTTQVSGEAFYEAPIKSVYFPEGLETLQSGSFANCDSVVTIYIPGSVKNISGAFCNMRNLRSVRIPPEMKVIGNASFVGCTSLKAIEIPEGVERIGLDAFAKCSALKHVLLPQSLDVIERGVFWECSALEEIVIPAGVSEIGDYAFYNCTALRDVYNYAVEPQKITMIFNSKKVLVHVPAQALEAYKNDINWSSYNIIGDL